MKIVHLTQRSLSSKAEELIQFDMDSIRLIAAPQGQQPDVWLADPDQYEKNGRILRDSTSPRLLGYTSGSTTLYVTDGCNSCSHPLHARLETLNSSQLQEFSSKTGIRLELLEKLSAIEL